MCKKVKTGLNRIQASAVKASFCFQHLHTREARQPLGVIVKLSIYTHSFTTHCYLLVSAPRGPALCDGNII